MTTDEKRETGNKIIHGPREAKMKSIVAASAVAALFLIHYSALAQYVVSTSALSGGGGNSSSASFRNLATIGQATPLEVEGDASSDNFRNMPGFWHTTDAVPACGSISTLAASFGSKSGDLNYDSQCDFDDDGDVDGVDLAEFSRLLDMPM